MIIYQSIVLLSAALLFLIEPMVGKILLPSYGGSPSVWMTCLLFFQLVLFIGYSCAHLLHGLKSRKQQLVCYLLLLVLAVLLLPRDASSLTSMNAERSPIISILLLLARSIGAPYLVLTMTSSLFQAWCATTVSSGRVYSLYSISNAGSLLALLAYPTFVEPHLDTFNQLNLWSLACLGFALIAAFGAWKSARSEDELRDSVAPALSPIKVNPAAPHFNKKLLWCAQSMCGSVLLLSVTNFMTTDIAPVPLLWVGPLAVYLISFILCFSATSLYSRRALLVLGILVVSGMILFQLLIPTVRPALQLILFAHAALFIGCMICHGELAGSRPDRSQLTIYYLALSFGGVLGGVFVVVIAPLLFRSTVEPALSFLGTAEILAIGLSGSKKPSSRQKAGVKNAKLPLLAVSTAVAVAAVTVIVWPYSHFEDSTFYRNFFGVLRVDRHVKTGFGKVRRLSHGVTLHGIQYEDSARAAVALAYFYPNSGVGRVLTNFHPDRPRRIGIIGLGSGIVASYGKAGDLFRFYELNPDVIDIAHNQFTFLANSQAQLETLEGDARILLRKEEPERYDVLLLDAFSGDSIPAHLLTIEAFELYLRHLTKDGIIAVHISNIYLDLLPVVGRVALELGLHIRFVVTDTNLNPNELPAHYALLSASDSSLNSLPLPDISNLDPAIFANRPLWSDSFNSLLPLLR